MIVWNLVASDGGGLLKGAFDPLGIILSLTRQFLHSLTNFL
jgi:hypothetical protein